ncbi:serine/threonine-protein kinase [Nocardioides sp. GCM10027113]|uniref:serine/threonine-protein kinase n=1 Tax=unclassified Nocardioides TaxID=2615069 RepID=UPI003611024E
MIAGRYELEREIGRGGMGAVWLARDAVLGRMVAVKRIGMVPGGGSPDLERAEREARLAARLNHPHVVAVFDLVTEGDERWLVMEHVDGSTLAELVRREGPMAPDRAASLLAQAADALAAAHTAGIVHRDVKPSNMLVTADGQVKLSDFGIARAEADATLTQTGLVTGSPAYLAPEVAAGQPATPASDVWSLGATLFHALSGRPPYEVGDNLMGTLYRIVHEEPPRLPDAGRLGPLLAATMTREPAERWPMSRVRDTLHGGGNGRARMPAAAPAPSVSPRPRASEDTHTDVLPAGAAPVPPPAATPDPTSGRGRRSRGRLLVAAAVAVLLGLVVWLLLGGEDDPGGAQPQGDRTTATRQPSPTGTAEPRQPSAEEMESFIADYLATAPSDPASGFRMLTADFQRQSGGIDGYRGFWDRVASADLVSVQADPESLTVRYTVDYTLENGDRTTDNVQLALVMAGDGYKIAGES